jgi:hypothetical protein
MPKIKRRINNDDDDHDEDKDKKVIVVYHTASKEFTFDKQLPHKWTMLGHGTVCKPSTDFEMKYRQDYSFYGDKKYYDKIKEILKKEFQKLKDQGYVKHFTLIYKKK